MLVYEPSSLPSTEGGSTSTALMVASGRETGYEPMNRSAIMLWIGSGALFSREVALSIVVDDFAKGCYTRTTRDTYGRGPYTD
jgi:hypothetical protein